ncbi:hypothetical protein NLJ89_g12091 [Agrocybe chaxingu]|uniref:Eukaryotic translation initiation factor 3 subunit C N-terminal domain-containing protein n=1 Tax=Agrocybe chaxingu TaxID=84603 RepID=A0A9W8JMY9_9AGAR|nr:hypothetical protein NLJ89_g12091 [Agrocybe chaxingu]
MGIVNIGIFGAMGRAFYVQPGLRRDAAAISTAIAVSVGLLSIEGFAAEQYRQTPRGQEEERRAKQEGALIFKHAREQILRPGVLGGIVGLVNTAVLGVVGYASYVNWGKTWDRRTVSAISMGLLMLWGGEGQAGDSDSESSESEDELMSSEEEEAPAKPTTTAKPAMSRFLRTAGSDSSSSDSETTDDTDDGDKSDESDSEDDEEEKPVRILSAVDKRLKEMEVTGVAMENALKINDWVVISNEFDKLVRMIQRQLNLSEPVPALYIRTLVNFEVSVNSTIQKEKEAKRKMNASNGKALTAMKHKIKKAIKENEADVKKYQDVRS